MFLQELLFQSASLELFVLRLAYRTKPEETKLTFCNGVVLSLEQCQRSFGDWLHSILEFGKTLHILDVDLSAFACLCALTLVTGKYTLSTSISVDSIFSLLFFLRHEIDSYSSHRKIITADIPSAQFVFIPSILRFTIPHYAWPSGR